MDTAPESFRFISPMRYAREMGDGNGRSGPITGSDPADRHPSRSIRSPCRVRDATLSHLAYYYVVHFVNFIFCCWVCLYLFPPPSSPFIPSPHPAIRFTIARLVITSTANPLPPPRSIYRIFSILICIGS